MTKSFLQLVATANRHAEAEGAGDLEAILATMEGEPVYEFYPARRCFRGMEQTRRFYEHFISDVRVRMRGARSIGEWIGALGVVQEYEILIQCDGAVAPSSHRIIALLKFGAEGLSGERMYADDTLLRTLCGPLWDELEPIP